MHLMLYDKKYALHKTHMACLWPAYWMRHGPYLVHLVLQWEGLIQRAIIQQNSLTWDCKPEEIVGMFVSEGDLESLRRGKGFLNDAHHVDVCPLFQLDLVPDDWVDEEIELVGIRVNLAVHLPCLTDGHWVRLTGGQHVQRLICIKTRQGQTQGHRSRSLDTGSKACIKVRQDHLTQAQGHRSRSLDLSLKACVQVR